MPKRIVHGEGIWGSDKLARVQPEWVRPEYANLIPLALANGVFECNVKRIWSNVYSYNRPEISVDKVEIILSAFQEAGLLFTWDVQGKTWGYWVGIEKTGRLPNPSRLKRKHDSVGPTPPSAQLMEYFRPTGQRPADGDQGFGSGLGSGEASSSEAKAPDSEVSENLDFCEDVKKIADLLRLRILKNNPNAKLTDVQVGKWARDVERMVRLDKRDWDHIRQVIEFSQADPFWSTVVLSMGKVREKFDQLWMRHGAASKAGEPKHRPHRQELTTQGRELYKKHGIAIGMAHCYPFRKILTRRKACWVSLC